MKALLGVLSLTVMGLVIGCGPTIQQDQVITLKLQETTGTEKIRVTVQADGTDIFGPLATLNPGESKTFTLNDPAGQKQVVGPHTILYTFDRVGVWGTVGHAKIQVLAGENVVFEDNSRKVLTGFAPTYAFRYVLAAGKSAAPATGATEKP